MSEQEYFERVTNHKKVMEYLDQLLCSYPTLLDTNIVPTLEHIAKQRVLNERIVPTYNQFMESFNGWLRHSDKFKLILVPGVREELHHRLQAAGHYAAEVVKKKKWKDLEDYVVLVDDTVRIIDGLKPFSYPLFYNQTLELLTELHKTMKWQKEDHKKGNADDQIVAASIVYGINEHTPVKVVSNDASLVHTLFSFHRFLSSKEVSPNEKNILPVVSELRNLEIMIETFKEGSKEIGYVGSTKDFHFPYHYAFREDMQQIGRIGFRESSKAYQKEQERLVGKIHSFHTEYNQALVIEMRRRQEQEKGTAALQPSKPKVSAPEEKKPVMPENNLANALEYMFSIITPEPTTFEEVSTAERGYNSLVTIAERCNDDKFVKKINERKEALQEVKRNLRIAELNNNIKTKKSELLEASSHLDDKSSVERVITISTELKQLYEQLQSVE